MATRTRFKFSRMLTDPTETGPIMEYMEKVKEENVRAGMAQEQLKAEFEELLVMLRRRHKIPHALTICVDPHHHAEHQVVFINSQETEDFEVPDDGPRSIH